MSPCSEVFCFSRSWDWAVFPPVNYTDLHVHYELKHTVQLNSKVQWAITGGKEKLCSVTMQSFLHITLAQIIFLNHQAGMKNSWTFLSNPKQSVGGFPPQTVCNRHSCHVIIDPSTSSDVWGVGHYAKWDSEGNSYLTGFTDTVYDWGDKLFITIKCFCCLWISTIPQFTELLCN